MYAGCVGLILTILGEAPIWLGVIGLYLMLVRFFGKGFVVEGAVIVIILSMLLGIGLNAYFDWQNKREIDTVKTNAKASN